MSGVTPEPNYFGRKLQRALKKLREENLLTQEEAGERCHIEFKKLSRIERRQIPTYHELVMMLDTYGVLSCDYGPYLRLWEKARRKGWWRTFQLTERDLKYIRMESEAQFKCEFQLGRIPVLLQTEEYGHATLTACDEEARKSAVEVRMRQQKRLTDEPFLVLHALIHEPVLHQGVDRSQLRELVTRARMPNVTVQVVPQASMHDGLSGSLSLLSFNDEDEPDCVFTETPFGPVEIEDPDQIQEARRLLHRVATAALSPDDSISLITEVSARSRARKLVAVSSK